MRRLSGVLGGTLGVGLSTLLLCTSAVADDDDQWASPDDGGIDYGIELGPTDSHNDSPDGTDYSDEDYTPTDNGTVQLSPEEQLEVDTDGFMCTMTFTCPDAPPETDVDVEQEEPPPPVNPADLGQTLLGRMEAPSPNISIAPAPPRPTLVRLWTWFWVPESQWQSRSDSISLRGTTVTVSIEPESVTWDTGEGTTTCDGPGEPWTAGSDAETSSCGHEYKHTTVDQPGGKYSVSATMTWRASWSCSGVCIADGGDLGTIESESESARLEVRQRQSLVIE